MRSRAGPAECCSFSFAAPSLPALAAERSAYVLANEKLAVELGAAGQLLALENRVAGERYAFAGDGFQVETDKGTLSSMRAKVAAVQRDARRLVFRYEAEGALGVELVYTLEAQHGSFRRTIKLANSAALGLVRVRFGATRFAAPAEETVHYLTFWMAPTVEFVRYARGGLFTGIEIPSSRARSRASP